MKIEENKRRGRTGDLYKNWKYQGNTLLKDRHNKRHKW